MFNVVEEKSLFHVCFRVDMGCGLDIWRIFGEDISGKSIMIGSPESYTKISEREFLVKTISGSCWHLNLCLSVDVDSFEIDLKECIENKGFKAV